MREILEFGSLNLLSVYDNWTGKIIECFYQMCDLRNYMLEERRRTFEIHFFFLILFY